MSIKHKLEVLNFFFFDTLSHRETADEFGIAVEDREAFRTQIKRWKKKRSSFDAMLDWQRTVNHETQPGGRMVIAAWDKVPAELILKGFLQAGISGSMDGMQRPILRFIRFKNIKHMILINIINFVFVLIHKKI